MRKSIVGLKFFLFIFFLNGVISYCGASDSIRLQEMKVLAEKITPDLFKIVQNRLVLPDSPEGYRLDLVSTDRLPVIDAKGEVGKVIETSNVNLFLTLTSVDGKHTVEVPNILLTVGKEIQPTNYPRPFVVPSLREWNGKEGYLQLNNIGKIIIDPNDEAELRTRAEQFAADLKELKGLDYSVQIGKPEDGSIYLTLSTSDSQLGNEGYLLTINNYIRIEALKPIAIFWGSRTVLQMIQQQGLKLINGIARDYPKYEKRGFVLDAGRKYIQLSFLQNYVKLMSYYKLNDFHVHLNDNAFPQFFEDDWDKTYSAFRLESSTYPGLAAKDGHYTKKEFTALQEMGMKYGVNIIPEIDVPAHSLAFTKYRKSIGSKEYGMDHLDILNPETYEFIDALFLEYIGGENPVFIGPDVHIGTDEYSKKEAEAFRKFTDHYIRFVQKHGKIVRLWGALTHAKGETPVTSEGVVMNAWYNGYADPREMVKQGYKLISTPDGYLYIVPVAGYYYDYLNNKLLYEKWEPVVVGQEVFPFGHPAILGGSFAVWNDHSGNGITEYDIHHRVMPSIYVLAEKMWSGASDRVSYEKFKEATMSMIEAPGVNLLAKVPSKSSLVLNYSPEKDCKKDFSGNNYDIVNNIKASCKGNKGWKMEAGSHLETPVEQIGYNYSVSFSIFPESNNPVDAILFSSNHAKLILNEKESGKLGFSREGITYTFNYVPKVGQWSHLTLEGDNKGTSLYVEGKLIERLEGKIIKVEKGGGNNTMRIQQTLIFPLKYIGDSQNGFKGYIKDIKVYNQKMKDTNN